MCLDGKTNCTDTPYFFHLIEICYSINICCYNERIYCWGPFKKTLLFCHETYKLEFSISLQCQRPYHVECTASRPISEVKQRWVWLVLGWVTAWEHQMLLVLQFCFVERGRNFGLNNPVSLFHKHTAQYFIKNFVIQN